MAYKIVCLDSQDHRPGDPDWGGEDACLRVTTDDERILDHVKDRFGDVLCNRSLRYDGDTIALGKTFKDYGIEDGARLGISEESIGIEDLVNSMCAPLDQFFDLEVLYAAIDEGFHRATPDVVKRYLIGLIDPDNNVDWRELGICRLPDTISQIDERLGNLDLSSNQLKSFLAT